MTNIRSISQIGYFLETMTYNPMKMNSVINIARKKNALAKALCMNKSEKIALELFFYGI